MEAAESTGRVVGIGRAVLEERMQEEYRSPAILSRGGLDHTGQSTALLEVSGLLASQPPVDPVVAVLYDAVTEHLGDRLESLFGLLTCLGERTIVRGALRHVPLDCAHSSSMGCTSGQNGGVYTRV